mgnify:CR=1 FL=1
MDAALKAFAAIDEIAIVAAPGILDDAMRDKLVTHCAEHRRSLRDLRRPGPCRSTTPLTHTPADTPTRRCGAEEDRPCRLVLPWIRVFDPGTKLQHPTEDGTIAVPPSGHIAGIYARVDNNRGVHKAPANEAILGALDVSQPLSKADQDGLNPAGVSCIRVLNSNILVWGARTVGGDANADLKYINVRRTLLFLRESIDEGTQWVVFEPNEPGLWQKITRNITAFLTNVWRSGALFGTTPAAGVLRQVRRGNQSARTPRARPGGHRNRRRDRAAGRVSDLPHQPSSPRPRSSLVAVSTEGVVATTGLQPRFSGRDNGRPGIKSKRDSAKCRPIEAPASTSSPSS